MRGCAGEYLQWRLYNALLWKYLKPANGKTAGEKVFVCTAMALLDSFHIAMDDEVREETGVEGEIDAKGGGEGDDRGNEREAACDMRKRASSIK